MVAPIQIGSGIEIGSGISVGGSGSYSITLQASDFSSAAPFNHQTIDYPICLGTNGTDGFTLDLSNIPPDSSFLLNVAYNPWTPIVANTAIQTWFENLVTAGVLTRVNEPVAMTVTWGAGSSVPTSGAIVSGGVVSNYMYISPVDTGTAGWNTNPPNNSTTPSLAGTFMLPATFTVTPPVVSKGGWC